jgi:integrase
MLTIKALRARPKKGEGDKWISDGAVRGSGALWARISENAVAFYFRYTDSDGGKKALPLGGYDESGAKGLSLAQAREKAGALSKLYRDGIRDLHLHLDREREALERARRAADDAAKREREAALRSTLRQLLDAYVAHLKRQGKQSAKDVGSIFNTHVFAAVPELGARKAADVTVDEYVELLGKLTEAGKGRTAMKCRSYLRRAYQLAIESKTDPSAPLALRAFGITVNPLASIGALSQFNRARDRVLSAPEMGAFLRRVDALRESPQKDALQLAIYLGGQRPMQLLRVKATDVDLSAATVTLYDDKGRRTQPRRHVLPLVKEAAAILERRIRVTPAEAPTIFSNDRLKAMRHETVSVLVSDISEAMVKDEVSREPFQLRDLRRTAETMLASLKVSSDVRAQLQSHGLGGIQQRHYDRHEYSIEKRQALEKWRRHLATLKAGQQADVLPLRGARSASTDEAATP